MLFSTKYGNNIRTVSGTPQLFNDDSVLMCNTSAGPVVINLLEIPSNNWSTQYKLYVVDASNNANNNNITINAPAGHTINTLPSVSITTAGGSMMIRIAANNTYLGSFSYSLGALIDTGWLNLQGFSFITTPALVPQYRVIGSHIVFRGQLVIPLAKLRAALPFTSAAQPFGNSYATENISTPFTGAGGVTINADGTILFNNGNSVLQNVAHNPDNTYSSGVIIGSQRRVAAPPHNTGEYMVPYHAVFALQLSNTGTLKLLCLENIEAVNTGQSVGESSLRYINSRSIANTRIVDYRLIEDSAAAPATLIGHNAPGNKTAFVIGQAVNPPLVQHGMTHDPANANQVGGYQIPLMGFGAFK